LGRVGQNVSRALGSVGGQLGGMIGTASVLRAIQVHTDFDTVLRDIGVTAGKSGEELSKFIKSYGRELQDLSLKVGQTTATMTVGAQTLVAAGLDDGMIKQLLPALGRVTTAANAEMKDISSTAFQLSETMKIASGDMEKAFATLVVQGKQGRFELKNLAQYAPTVFSKMGMLQSTGLRGVSIAGAMLQTAMRGTADPGVAANNVGNFLQKINQKETLKNFQSNFGVDLTQVQQDALARGADPIEAVLKKIEEAAKISSQEIDAVLARAKKQGLDPGATNEEIRKRIEASGGTERIQRVFGDVQVLDFLSAYMQNRQFYGEVRDKGLAADPSIIQTDFASRMEGPAKKWEMAVERITQVLERLGEALAPLIDKIGQAAEAMLNAMRFFDEKIPGAVDGIVQLGAAAAVAAAALFTIRVGGALTGMLGGGGVAAATGGAAAVAAPATMGAIPAITAAGGLLASGFSTGVLAANEQAREALLDNPLLGAMWADGGFAAGIMNAGQQTLPSLPPPPPIRPVIGSADDGEADARYERSRRAQAGLKQGTDMEAARGLAMRRVHGAAPAQPQQVQVDATVDAKVEGEAAVKVDVQVEASPDFISRVIRQVEARMPLRQTGMATSVSTPDRGQSVLRP
jgi:hypothetical protein